MTKLKKIILIGASGSIGTPILEALIRAKSSFDAIAILTRPSSAPQFDKISSEHGIKILTVASYDNTSDLTAVFAGYDTVIAALGAAALDTQLKLIDAAVAAGVERFYPSEFGTATDSPALGDEPIFADKRKIQAYLLRQASSSSSSTNNNKLSFTALQTGSFADWALANGFIGFDINAKTAKFIDDGTAVASFTSLRDIGDATVTSLLHPDASKNAFIRVQGFAASQQDILKVLESETNSKWKVTKTPISDVLKRADEALEKKDFTTYAVSRIQAVLWGGNGAFEKDEISNQKIGWAPKDDLHAVVKQVLASK
ncbi:NAD(P)-binding protein [Saitoella complicata NRRL Y-17804]|nr:NAD(P)-binding protein [Saitoella complicata NRRL Y-17804]ODQ50921.1 NAD(P)-binding protein [Saitoella complicata NRRL Y-17804]